MARRNHRYFLLFLLTTGLHSLHTFILSLVSMSQLGIYISDNEGKDPYHILRVALIAYSGLFALVLIGFFAFQNHLILKDITSNEHLRGKWNADERNQRSVQQGMPPFWARLKYFYGEELSQSRVQKWWQSKQGISDDEEEAGLMVGGGAVDNESVLKEYGIIMLTGNTNDAAH